MDLIKDIYDNGFIYLSVFVVSLVSIKGMVFTYILIQLQLL